ncbi:MAG: Crp/Fnr family transcriptional regulator [Hydrogenophaga sp.]|jgi:CRP/FNR family cyclic AMP-dependent transcriptional regulator|uniref:Crp/Fnr family transcriptional regulator n=1 Tax=Hydrogenophaga sp. TaxID=1904254 RepID=UPI0040369C33
MCAEAENERPATGRELDRIPWVAVLSGEDRAWVVPRLRVREWEAGRFVVRAGDPSTHWRGVLEGMLRVEHPHGDEDHLMFSGIPAGGWFGEGTLLKGHAFMFSVQALRKSVVASLAAADFHLLARRSIAFNRHAMGQLNERLAQFIAAREIERMVDDEQRLACSLLWLRNPVLFPSAGNVLSITQQDLSNLIGISRQRVNRALARLESRGVLRAEYRTLRVLDAQKLVDLTVEH